MKKILFLLFAVFTLNYANAQIIITGYMNDPAGTDDDNNEYMQFKATQDIDFSVTPYSVVTCSNRSNETPDATVGPVNGWAGGGYRTYKFNLTSGTVAKGDLFYVGGTAKLINGVGSTSIASAKWIRTIEYMNVNGDGFGTARAESLNIAPTPIAKTGLIPNNSTPGGIAVFNTTTVDKNSIPIDVVFLGPDPVTTNMKNATNTYRITNNDHYSLLSATSVAQPYLFSGTNTYVFLYGASGSFVKLGGSYNTTTSTWTVPRVVSYVVLSSTSTLADIESETTLPVSLTSFTAKSSNNKVQLNWETASENNNSHFDILRSTDGINFSVISTVQGNGNSTVNQEYNYSDFNPSAGTSYYQLRQVDFNGISILSKVISANNTNEKKSSLSVTASSDNTIKVFAYSNISGKADLQITDIYGRKLLSAAVNLEKGYNSINLPVTLITGIYVASLQVESEYINTKFFK